MQKACQCLALLSRSSPTKKVALAAWSEFAVTTHITNMTPVFIVFFLSKYAAYYL